MPERRNRIVHKLQEFHEDERSRVFMNLSKYTTTARTAKIMGVSPTPVNHLSYEGRLEGKKIARD